MIGGRPEGRPPRTPGSNRWGGRLRLRLVGLKRDRIEFEAVVGDSRRPVVALISPSGVPRFPHVATEGGLSLGREDWDERVRERVSELLVLRRAGRFGLRAR